MGLFDKIKDKVGEGLAQGMEFVSQKQAELQKNKEEAAKKAAEQQKAAQQQPAEPKKIVKDYEIKCAYGDFGKCSYFADEFCFTCPKTQPCAKKKEHLSCLAEPINSKWINYANELEYTTNGFKTTDNDYLKRIYAEKTFEIYSEFAEEFYPNLVKVPGFVGMGLRFGISEKNMLAWKFIDEVNKCLNPSKMHEKRLKDILTTIVFRPQSFPGVATIFSTSTDIYDADTVDFYFLLKYVMFFLEDTEKNKEIFKDPTKISHRIFFDGEDKLKRVGYGGESAGEFGDTLWNTIELILNENVKDEELYKEYLSKYDSFIEEKLK